ncbi:MAG: D-glycerate dehydrogenase [Acidimicrobiia bacterium]|nr:D-glycerate dehydrogenase [Acidimicrobiia bacterium]
MHVYLTFDPPGPAADMLREHHEVTVWDGPGFAPADALAAHLPDLDGLYCTLTTPVDQALLDAAPRLRVVSQFAVGVDNIDLEACRARGIAVGHTPDVLTETTADTAFGLLLAGSRRFVEGLDHIRAGEWRGFEMTRFLGGDIHHTTLGIVGMGRIGEAIARRAAGFDMDVLFTRRRTDPSELGQRVDLDELLATADHVVVAAPLTPETHHLIDETALRRMRPTAGLVNIARGPIVDTDALIRALAEGWIRYAALDVTDPEPLPADHPLMALPNCLVVPHLGSSSTRAREAMGTLAAENLLAGLAGRPMPARIA